MRVHLIFFLPGCVCAASGRAAVCLAVSQTFAAVASLPLSFAIADVVFVCTHTVFVVCRTIRVRMRFLRQMEARTQLMPPCVCVRVCFKGVCVCVSLCVDVSNDMLFVMYIVDINANLYYLCGA